MADKHQLQGLKISVTILELSNMKVILAISSLLISLSGWSQTFDFGIEYRTNNNNLSNRYDLELDNFTRPGHQTNELGSFRIPDYNFGFVDDQLELVYVRFDEVKMDNNIDIPLYLKFTTKNNWTFDLRMSTGKYRMEYQGGIFRDPEYYAFYNLSFEEYVDQYGGIYDEVESNTNTEETYNDETAYIRWFDHQANSDPFSKASVALVEELKFKSFHFWFGKRFYEHKRIQPFVKLGLHFRTAEASFKRKHFAIDDNFFGQVLTKSDLSELSTEIPSFSDQTLGIGTQFGFEFYRYHFAFSAEYSFNLSDDFADKSLVFDFQDAGAGFRTYSLAIGVDLFSHDFRTKNSRKTIYNNEFNSVSSALDKNRLSYTVVNIKFPVMSEMNHDREFSLVTIEDILVPEDSAINFGWQSLSFKDIDRVDWSSKIEVGWRYNVIKPIDIEVTGGFSTVNIDRKVQEVNTTFIYDTITNQFYYDLLTTDVNYAAFRSKFLVLQLGTNVYVDVLRKDAFDLRIFGGAAINGFALLEAPSQEFGVNGKGNDIYTTAEDLLFYTEDERDLVYNADNSFYSDYAEDIDLNAPANNYIIAMDQTSEPLSSFNLDQTLAYPTANVGFEFEFNRFLAGASAEFSFLNVDNFLVENYYNINLNLGYIIQSSNRVNKKLKD